MVRAVSRAIVTGLLIVGLGASACSSDDSEASSRATDTTTLAEAPARVGGDHRCDRAAAALADEDFTLTRVDEILDRDGQPTGALTCTFALVGRPATRGEVTERTYSVGPGAYVAEAVPLGS